MAIPSRAVALQLERDGGVFGGVVDVSVVDGDELVREEFDGLLRRDAAHIRRH